ncbi:MAG: twin-arginine translocase TatA/TatE family subunit [Planctomycetota bacterium]|nr:twin-arginine translocase TatA/TatE family subunit [Planctomycetota bacterium]
MNMFFAIGMPGLPEMLIIGGIFILFFGANKLPGLARSIGKSANEFKKGIRDNSPVDDPEDDDTDEADDEFADGEMKS